MKQIFKDLFAPIEDGDDITRPVTVALVAAIIVAVIILTIALLHDYLTHPDIAKELAAQRKQKVEIMEIEIEHQHNGGQYVQPIQKEKR